MARRTGVTPPTFTPRTGGLFTVAPPVTFIDAHERGGVDWRSEPSGEARSWAAACDATPEERAKEFDGRPVYVESDPFAVYAGEVCPPVGMTPDERDRRMVAAVTNGEERAVERVLWTGETTNGATVDLALASADAVAVTGGPIVAALARLEAALAEEYGGVGVLHLPVDAAAIAAAAGAVESVQGRLQTILGTRVVAGGGYPGTGPAGEAKPADGSYVYATGAVAVRRGPIEPLGDFASTFDRAVNNSVRVGERTYVVGFDGPHFVTTVTYPSNGGA